MVPVTEVSFTSFRGKTLCGRAWGTPPTSSTDTNTVRVLALHGWLDNCATWDNILPQLFESFSTNSLYVVALDAAGHGRSHHRGADSDYTLFLYMEDTVAVLDSLGWGSNFCLMGHSMGGVVCTLLAGVIPERVGAVITIESLGPYAHSMGDEALFLSNYIIRRQSRRNRLPTPKRIFLTEDEAVKARMDGVHKLSYDAAKPLVIRGCVSVENGSGLIWSSDSVLSGPSPIWFFEAAVKSFLTKITCPVLVIWGEDGGMAEGFNAKAREPLVKKLTKVLVPGGHHCHLEPDTISACVYHITNFLSRDFEEHISSHAKL